MGISNCNNFVEILKYRATEQPKNIAYTFLVDGENEEISITYSELNVRAETIANKLRETCIVGDRALLLFPSCLDFISAFFGCLYAGVIAVPAYPPRRNRKMDRLIHIIEDCKAKVVISTGQMFHNSLLGFEKNDLLNELKWIKVEDVKNIDFDNGEKNSIPSNQLALIQYTSGSTGDPKGIMVSHKNLFENASIQYDLMEYSDKSIVVSWLPFFHDMGLIGIILQSIFGGFLTILMSPEAFILKPIRWLRAISKYKATHSFAPNFAYDLCCDTVKEEELAGLDISNWKVALNAAEPVNAKTLEAFSLKMKAIGFRNDSHYPGYGMAESTLVISCPKVQQKTKILEIDKEKFEQKNVIVKINDQSSSSKRIVGCGRLGKDHRVLIVEPISRTVCKDCEVGEIWISGRSVAQGYWNKPELTEKIFHAYTLDTNEGPFLRTGDLGIFYDNELFITGRSKDLIIIRGRNYYPQDIEFTVSESHKSLVSGGTAAFSIESDKEEKLIVIQEVKRTSIDNLNAKDVFEAIKRAVTVEHELQIFDIVLIKPMRLLKTSSGKVQRKSNKKAYLERNFEDIVAKMLSEEESELIKPPNPLGYKSTVIQNLTIAKIANFLEKPVESINVEASFESFGLDSLKAVRFIGELSKEFGKDLSPTLFYDYPSIASLSNYLEKEKEVIASCFSVNNKVTQDIAIIGMSCRFPGASDIASFWNLLISGKDVISEMPSCRNGLVAENQPIGGYLNDIDKFDAEFFGITPKEARLMDPQQRILMEESYNALLDSGFDPSELANSNTGVFVGISQNDYSQICKYSKDCDSPYLGTGNALSIAANRLSYFYDFKGPSIAVDTACSSSLVALHQAVNSLRRGECDMAIVAGVNLNLNSGTTKALENANMLAADGRCKTFDASADGYVRSEGCGVVVVKSYDSAIKEKDNILAIIKGSAIVQDGKSNGLSAPNGIAQQKVIIKALEDAQLAPQDLHFIETHGTGTKLGDPIEIEAIAKVLGGRQGDSRKLLLGAVKANIGHLESAAGIAGLIKTILCIQNKKLPGQLHFEHPNQLIKWDQLPVVVPRKLTDISTKDNVSLKAGVSSFGFGGMNAHIIVEEAPTTSDDKTNSTLRKALTPYSFQRKSYWVELENKALDIKRYSKGNLLFDLFQKGKLDTIEKLIKSNGTLESTYFEHLPAILIALNKSVNIDLHHRPVSELFYHFHWKPKDNFETTSSFPKGHYVIFSEIGGLGEKLSKKLQDQMSEYSLIYPSDSYKALEPDKYQINATHEQDYRQLLSDIKKNAGLPINHIIYLWSADVVSDYDLTPSALKTALVFGCNSVLYLIQSLISLSITPSIWLFTRSSQLVSREEKLILATTPIWGFGKVIPLEHPQLHVRLIDLDQAATNEEQIIQNLVANNPKESLISISIRNEQVYTGRLIKSIREQKKALSFDSKATYLITGGLGALGLHTANWLASNGVKNLILISRSKPATSKTNILNSLRAAGVHVHIVQADVCDFSQISKVFYEIDNKTTPLKGVIHTAGVEESRLLEHMRIDHMNKVMNPKVIGSWHLHELTKNIDLDFFVMFSSISAVWGGARQAHYAAGNAFLDSLALYRKIHGLPAMSVNWGPWEGGGMADGKRLKELEKRGVGALSPEQGIEALEYLLERDCTNPVVADIDWDKFKQLYEISGQGAFFEEIETTSQMPPDSFLQSEDILSQINNLPQQEKIRSLVLFLQKEVAQILEYEEGELPDLDKGFNEMGIDSLMAVDLKCKLEERFHASFPVTILFEHPNINALTNFIALEILGLSIASRKDTVEEKIESDQKQPVNLQVPSDKDAEDLINKTLIELNS